jgi:hypothetical protein
MVAGLMAACYLLLHRSPASRLEAVGETAQSDETARFRARWRARLGDSDALSIPYAPAFSIGTLFSFFGQ